MLWICYWIDQYKYWDVFYLKFVPEEVIQIAAQRHAKTFGREFKGIVELLVIGGYLPFASLRIL